MARGVMKGKPDGPLLRERLRLEGTLKMNAREIFEERAAVHAAAAARAARRPVVVDEGVRS